MCVVRLKGESVAQAFDQSDMQGMVAAGAQEVPREGAIQKGIGTPSRRRVQSSLWHRLPLSWRLNKHTLDSAGTFWQYWRVVVCGGDFTGEMISRIQAKVNAG